MNPSQPLRYAPTSGLARFISSTFLKTYDQWSLDPELVIVTRLIVLPTGRVVRVLVIAARQARLYQPPRLPNLRPPFPFSLHLSAGSIPGPVKIRLRPGFC